MFGNLKFLWLLWLIPGLLFFYMWATNKKNLLIEKFVSKDLKDKLLLGFSRTRQRFKIFLILMVITLSVLALIRPKWGFHWEEIKRKGVDIVVALDVSKSMLAEDVSPNRLERAKREIIDLINLLQGDRLGLVAFSGTSFIQSPLTLDYGAVKIFLDDLDTDLIPVPGTAIADAIEKSIKAFDPDDGKSRVIILITDGEDHMNNPLEAAQRANEQKIKIYTIGIGAQEGAPIPDQGGGFKKDNKGNVVLTQLDETSLQKIALETGGSYVRSVSGDLDLENIYKDINKTVEDKELKSGKRKRFEERYQWVLMLAFLLLILEVFISERTNRKILGVFLLCFLYNHPANALFQSDLIKDGEKNYSKGQYKEAISNFLTKSVENPTNRELKFNLGNSYYKGQNYQEAYNIFNELKDVSDKKMSQKAYYNLGNTAFRLGKLEEAIEHYHKATTLEPSDEDAKFNLELARKELKKRIEENKKRQDQQQKQDQQKQDQQKQDQQKQDQQNQDQQNQDQQKQDQQNQDQQKQDQQKQDQQKQDQQKQDQQNQDQQKQDQTSGGGEKQKPENKMSEKEAARLLNNIDENRKKYLQQKLQQSGRYQVDKDW